MNARDTLWEVQDAWLYRLARQLTPDAALAEDLLQDARLIAWQRPPQHEDAPRAWLKRVLVNLAASRGRSARRRVLREAGYVEAHEELSPDLEHEMVRAEILRVLAQEVGALAEPYRSTVTLYYFEELSAAEIATRFEISESSVRWRLMKAREELRDAMRRALPAAHYAPWMAGPLFHLPAGGPTPAPEIEGPASALSPEAGMASSGVASPLAAVVSVSALIAAFVAWGPSAGAAVQAPSRPEAPSPSDERTAASFASASTPTLAALAANDESKPPPSASPQLASPAAVPVVAMSTPAFMSATEAHEMWRDAVQRVCRPGVEPPEQGVWAHEDENAPDWCTSAEEISMRARADEPARRQAWEADLQVCSADAKTRGVNSGGLLIARVALRDEDRPTRATEELEFLEGTEVYDAELLDCVRSAMLSAPLVDEAMGPAWVNMDLLVLGYRAHFGEDGLILGEPSVTPFMFGVDECV